MLDGMIWRFGLSRISLAINSQCYIGSIATARDPCRSRVVVTGNRRVNYYLKHLLVAARRAAVDVPLRAMQTCGTEDEHGKFSNASCFNRLLCPPRILQRVQAMSCIVKLQDPEIAIHPILVQLGDLVWKPCLQGRQWQFPPLVHARGRVCNDLMSTCIHGLRNDLVYWRFLRGLLTKSVCFSRSLSLSAATDGIRTQFLVLGVRTVYGLREQVSTSSRQGSCPSSALPGSSWSASPCSNMWKVQARWGGPKPTVPCKTSGHRLQRRIASSDVSPCCKLESRLLRGEGRDLYLQVAWTRSEPQDCATLLPVVQSFDLDRGGHRFCCA